MYRKDPIHIFSVAFDLALNNLLAELPLYTAT